MRTLYKRLKAIGRNNAILTLIAKARADSSHAYFQRANQKQKLIYRSAIPPSKDHKSRKLIFRLTSRDES